MAGDRFHCITRYMAQANSKLIISYLGGFCHYLYSIRRGGRPPLSLYSGIGRSGRLLLGLVQGVHHQLHHRLMDAQGAHQVGVLEKHAVVCQLPGNTTHRVRLQLVLDGQISYINTEKPPK